MITLLCLLLTGAWPHQVGIPLWVLFVSLAFDIALAIRREQIEKVDGK